MGAVAIDTDKFIMSHLVLEDSGYSLLPRSHQYFDYSARAEELPL
jgi:hypothetical protein